MRLLLVAGLLAVFVCSRGNVPTQRLAAEERAQPAAAGALQGVAAAGFIDEFQRQDARNQDGDVKSPLQQKEGAAVQAEISRSGRDFLEVCSSVDSGGSGDAARVQRDATCLGWVEGFADGFLVYGELLSVPRKDRMACVPRGVTNIQLVRVIRKYLAANPGKAHRPTRYIASIALAGAFPCKAGK